MISIWLKGQTFVSCVVCITGDELRHGGRAEIGGVGQATSFDGHPLGRRSVVGARTCSGNGWDGPVACDYGE